MTQSATPVWVEMAILFALVLVWFYLVTSLFRRLRTDHHAKFVEMGEPSLFVNNSPRTSFLLLRFLFRREDKELGDRALTKLTKTMLVFFFIYVLLFLGVFVTIYVWANWH
jgi:TRAP-type C4-dicarboxylate transport system permease small subunit